MAIEVEGSSHLLTGAIEDTEVTEAIEDFPIQEGEDSPEAQGLETIPNKILSILSNIQAKTKIVATIGNTSQIIEAGDTLEAEAKEAASEDLVEGDPDPTETMRDALPVMSLDIGKRIVPL